MQTAFDGLLQAVAVGFQTMQQAQKDMQSKTEKMIGQEAVNHMKILAEKTKMLEDLRIEFDRYKSEAEKVKSGGNLFYLYLHSRSIVEMIQGRFCKTN